MSRTLILLAALLAVIAGFIMLRDRSKGIEKADPTILKPTMTANSADAKFHEWHEFTSPQNNFKVLLPTLPQHVSDTVTDPATQQQHKYETYTALGDNGSAYLINEITFSSPKQAEATEEELKAAVSSMLIRNKENKLNSMVMGSLHDNPALDFSLDNNDVLIKGKVLAHNNKIYILSMINKKDTFNDKEFDFFVNSFNFDQAQKEPKPGEQ